MMSSGTFLFGQHTPKKTQIFFRSKLSYGFVNLKPVVEGHVLTIPKRKVERFSELTSEELTDLMLSSQKIGACLEKHYGVNSLTFVVQDGKDAGQTVFHVHVHILPRRKGDFERNDDIYDEIERIDADSREARTEETMEEEAKRLAALFPDNQMED